MPSHRSSPWQAAAAAFRHSSRSRADLLAYQDRAVARLVAHAGARVPFYRRLLDGAGVHAGEIRTANDLQLLPVTTKDEIRVAPACDLLDETLDPSRLVSISTTGSTGRPFRIVNSWLEYRILHLFRLRAQRQFGRRPGDRSARAEFRRLSSTWPSCASSAGEPTPLALAHVVRRGDDAAQRT